MAAFTKRTFGSFGQFWSDIRFLWSHGKDLRGNIIAPAFRERLMLAVTAVNQCRYCSFVHTRVALKTGVSKEEVKGLFTSNFTDAPENERVALLYAQHWTETRGCPDAKTVEQLNAAYPPETVNAIQATIRLINFNNLFGNTFDCMLHKISFGLLGGGK